MDRVRIQWGRYKLELPAEIALYLLIKLLLLLHNISTNV